MRRLRAQNRDSEPGFGGSRIADLSRRVCAGACFLTLHNEFFEKRNSVKQSRMAGQPRSRSQMAMSHTRTIITSTMMTLTRTAMILSTSWAA